MKRIGILTFHRAINYGACLQAYALKKYIKDQGNECDIIDYHCPAIEDFYNRVFLWEDSFKTIMVQLSRQKSEIFIMN